MPAGRAAGRDANRVFSEQELDARRCKAYYARLEKEPAFHDDARSLIALIPGVLPPTTYPDLGEEFAVRFEAVIHWWRLPDGSGAIDLWDWLCSARDRASAGRKPPTFEPVAELEDEGPVATVTVDAATGEALATWDPGVDPATLVRTISLPPIPYEPDAEDIARGRRDLRERAKRLLNKAIAEQAPRIEAIELAGRRPAHPRHLNEQEFARMAERVVRRAVFGETWQTIAQEGGNRPVEFSAVRTGVRRWAAALRVQLPDEAQARRRRDQIQRVGPGVSCYFDRMGTLPPK